MSDYDSRPDTHEHIAQVRGIILGVVEDLLERAHRHDRSKLEDPELAMFDEVTPQLRELTYGSREYHEALHHMQGVLDHHYAHNDHHPEHFKENGGIDGMDLVQMLEMLCDWLAATRRHRNGDIHESIDKNAERFGYGEEITALLHNTVARLEQREVTLAAGQ